MGHALGKFSFNGLVTALHTFGVSDIQEEAARDSIPRATAAELFRNRRYSLYFRRVSSSLQGEPYTSFLGNITQVVQDSGAQRHS